MQIEVGNIKIGVLSLQGGVIEHINHLKALGVSAMEVKKVADLYNIHGLILPGGESTTLGTLLRTTGMLEVLKERIKNGLPVWGTCAGMILLAKKLYNDSTVHLGLLDVEVKRNGYGRQLNSFKTNAVIPIVNPNEPVNMVFVRAPYITKLLSPTVDVLCKVDNRIVAVKQNNIIASSFHPELTNDLKFHKFFIDYCLQYNKI